MGDNESGASDPDSGEYGLRQQHRPNGTYGHWAHIEDTVKPKAEPTLTDHGTKVVPLGSEAGETVTV